MTGTAGRPTAYRSVGRVRAPLRAADQGWASWSSAYPFAKVVQVDRSCPSLPLTLALRFQKRKGEVMNLMNPMKPMKPRTSMNPRKPAKPVAQA